MLPHRVQRLTFIAFGIGLLISIVLFVAIAKGVELSDSFKSGLASLVGGVMCLSAMIAPFTEEAVETDAVKDIRLKTIAFMAGVCFCLLMIAFFVRIILAQFPIDGIFNLRSLFLIEVIYFIILKHSSSKRKNI